MKGYELFCYSKCRRSVGEFEFSVGVSTVLNNGLNEFGNKMAQKWLITCQRHQEKSAENTEINLNSQKN